MKSLLSMLMDGHFHSGQEIGNLLGISRSAVWKKIQHLETDYGLSIHRVPGRGYRLSESLSLLDTAQLSQCCDDLGWSFIGQECLDSTNAECLRRVQQDYSRPFVVMAEYQQAGRGRRGRSWISPTAGQNLFFSLAMRLENSPSALAGLSLVTGLAVLQALREQGLLNAGLKWPNDVYANQRKIAGILLELTGNPVDVCHLVIGIGINVNMQATDAPAIDQQWTSLRQETGQKIDRTQLSRALIHSLHRFLTQHLALGFQSLKEQWEANHLWQGQDCVLSSASQRVQGRVLGVDNDGSLRLWVEGQEQRFCAGELSLRLMES